MTTNITLLQIFFFYNNNRIYWKHARKKSIFILHFKYIYINKYITLTEWMSFDIHKTYITYFWWKTKVPGPVVYMVSTYTLMAHEYINTHMRYICVRVRIDNHLEPLVLNVQVYESQKDTFWFFINFRRAAIFLSQLFVFLHRVFFDMDGWMLY